MGGYDAFKPGIAMRLMLWGIGKLSRSAIAAGFPHIAFAMLADLR